MAGALAASAADLKDWAETRNRAEAAAANQRELAWGRTAQAHYDLVQVYGALSGVCADIQRTIAGRRASYDTTSDYAAVVAHVHQGDKSGAAAICSKNRRLTMLAAAISGGDISSSLPKGRSGGSQLADAALIAKSIRPDAPLSPSLVEALMESADPIDRLVALVFSGSSDPASLAGDPTFVSTLQEAEAAMAAAPPERSHDAQIVRFGDPLLYGLLARAHAALCAEACNRVLNGGRPTDPSPYFAYRGLAAWALGAWEAARADLEHATSPEDAAIAAAGLSAVAYASGAPQDGERFAQECLRVERGQKSGEGLVALARFDLQTGRRGLDDDRAARELLAPAPVRTNTWEFSQRWARGVLQMIDGQCDSAKLEFLYAAEGRQPLAHYAFPAPYYATPALFCTDYLAALVQCGNSGITEDYLTAFRGASSLANVVPAARPVKEGLRWLCIEFGRAESLPLD